MPKGKSEPPKSRITFGKFENVDLRVARVVRAPLAEGTAAPSRVVDLDAGHLGTLTSVGQFALIDEGELVGRNVVVVANLGPREIGSHVSEALILGVRHPSSPPDQNQALPLSAPAEAEPGDLVF